MQDKFILYQQNVFPKMLESLSERLGVSASSIQQIGIGFNPLNQSWVTPERDIQGNIIGLIQRLPDGKKIMVKGSKRGLVYPFNQSGTIQDKKYNPGKQNWVRATKEYECPMCGKYGECLLSAENPSDPQAVLCAHITNGAVQHRATTHLHIRKEAGNLTSAKPFIESELPYLIVEGYSDVAAALDLGFTAIGRPAANAGIDLLPKLLHNESVIVIGENDEGAGKLGMEATFDALRSACKSVKKILPPKETKDLRSWCVDLKLTKENLLKYIETTPEIEINKDILTDTAPLSIARRWYDETQKNNLIHWQDDWWKFNGSNYYVVEEDSLIQELYLYLENKLKYNAKHSLVPFDVDRTKVQNILHALIAICQLYNLPDETEPFYINSKTGSFDAVSNILFKNGIYNILTERLKKHSSKLFNTSTLPYGYNPDAKCPLWLKFVNDIFNNDTQSISLLQQWIGYNLIASNALEKIMIFLGPPASGKSTVTDVIEALLGTERTTAITLNALNSEFGLAPLIGKYAAFLAEAYVSKNMDGMEILQKLKRLTGRDTVNVNRKYKSVVSTKLFARITYVANELPQFFDNPQALRRRAMILMFPNSYEKNPDITLKRKLCKEVQGIANWAIEGLKELQTKKQFIIPKISESCFDELRNTTCPLYGAIEECCTLSFEGFAPKDMLYDVCKAWLKENGFYLMSKVQFGRILKTIQPSIEEARPMINNSRIRGWKGIEINQEAKERYLK